MENIDKVIETKVETDKQLYINHHSGMQWWMCVSFCRYGDDSFHVMLFLNLSSRVVLGKIFVCKSIHIETNSLHVCFHSSSQQSGPQKHYMFCIFWEITSKIDKNYILWWSVMIIKTTKIKLYHENLHEPSTSQSMKRPYTPF